MSSTRKKPMKRNKLKAKKVIVTVHGEDVELLTISHRTTSSVPDVYFWCKQNPHEETWDNVACVQDGSLYGQDIVLSRQIAVHQDEHWHEFHSRALFDSAVQLLLLWSRAQWKSQCNCSHDSVIKTEGLHCNGSSTSSSSSSSSTSSSTSTNASNSFNTFVRTLTWSIITAFAKTFELHVRLKPLGRLLELEMCDRLNESLQASVNAVKTSKGLPGATEQLFLELSLVDAFHVSMLNDELEDLDPDELPDAPTSSWPMVESWIANLVTLAKIPAPLPQPVKFETTNHSSVSSTDDAEIDEDDEEPESDNEDSEENASSSSDDESFSRLSLFHRDLRSLLIVFHRTEEFGETQLEIRLKYALTRINSWFMARLPTQQQGMSIELLRTYLRWVLHTLSEGEGEDEIGQSAQMKIAQVTQSIPKRVLEAMLQNFAMTLLPPLAKRAVSNCIRTPTTKAVSSASSLDTDDTDDVDDVDEAKPRSGCAIVDVLQADSLSWIDFHISNNEEAIKTTLLFDCDVRRTVKTTDGTTVIQWGIHIPPNSLQGSVLQVTAECIEPLMEIRVATVDEVQLFVQCLHDGGCLSAIVKQRPTLETTCGVLREVFRLGLCSWIAGLQSHAVYLWLQRSLVNMHYHQLEVAIAMQQEIPFNVNHPSDVLPDVHLLFGAVVQQPSDSSGLVGNRMHLLYDWLVELLST